MVVSGFLFLSVRVFELVITVPIVGMLGSLVSTYNKANQLTPPSTLVLFIVSCLALGYLFFTIIGYFRARHDGAAVAFFDLCFAAAFIAGVVKLRGVAGLDCGSLSAGITTSGSYIDYAGDKTCVLRKASFALGIIDVLAFAVSMVRSSSPAPRSAANTAPQLLALLVWRNHRDDDRTVVRHHSSRHEQPALRVAQQVTRRQPGPAPRGRELSRVERGGESAALLRLRDGGGIANGGGKRKDGRMGRGS